MNYMQLIYRLNKSSYKWIGRLIRRKTALVVLAIYILSSFWFYWETFFSQIVYDRSQMGWEVTGEIRASEWGVEQVLSKLSLGENPFSRINGIMYPFGVDIVASDPGFAFMVAPFTYFFSTHQALMLMVPLAIILAGWGMFWLLKELGLSDGVAFIVGLAFEHNTFLLPRMGHVGFLASFWIFPWFFWLWLKMIRSQQQGIKVVYILLLAATYLASLWINFYYFMTLNLGIGILLVFLLWREPMTVWKTIKINWGYFLFGALALYLMSSPWVKTLRNTLTFSEVAKPQGWGGAIEFSADLFNIFVPSPYNYYYGELIVKLSKYVGFMQDIFEDYNYPGLLVLAGFGWGLWRIVKKKNWMKKIQLFYFTAIVIWILTLGPFLQIAGRMFVELEEGIRLVLPLPFAFLHYLPYLNNLRVPGRLAMGLIFFGLIVTAMMVEKIRKNLPSRKRRLMWILLLAIIVLDQRPVKMRLEAQVVNYPAKLYQIIRNDPEPVSVLLIPFTVRDGLTWFGDYNAVDMDYSQTYIGKPLIGGYTGRIPDYVKEYYRSNAFIGKVGRMLDPMLSTNPFMLNIPERDSWQENNELARRAINLLRIKYVVVQNPPTRQEVRYQEIEKYLLEIGYRLAATEGKSKLYQISIGQEEQKTINLGQDDDNLQLGMGWWSRERGYRWAQKKVSVILKNSEGGNYKVKVKGSSFFAPQTLAIYIDEESIGKTVIGTEEKTLESESVKLSPGLHVVHLLFEREDVPAEVSAGNLDARNLSAKISQIDLERVN